jgi:hypothetical protein
MVRKQLVSALRESVGYWGKGGVYGVSIIEGYWRLEDKEQGL